jgi:hypothetical protein
LAALGAVLLFNASSSCWGWLELRILGSIDLGFTGNTPKNGNLNFNRNKTADLMDLCCLVDSKIAM